MVHAPRGEGKLFAIRDETDGRAVSGLHRKKYLRKLRSYDEQAPCQFHPPSLSRHTTKPRRSKRHCPRWKTNRERSSWCTSGRTRAESLGTIPGRIALSRTNVRTVRVRPGTPVPKPRRGTSSYSPTPRPWSLQSGSRPIDDTTPTRQSSASAARCDLAPRHSNTAYCSNSSRTTGIARRGWWGSAS